MLLQSLFVLAFGIGLGLAGCSRSPLFEDEYKRFESVKVGMSEDEVRAKLGKPVHSYSKADAPESYYVEGYSFKEREISNKALIFVASEAIAYVYLDNNNKVEEVFVGGS
jgi:outer membrane protein assembly factor BamE (lipoprotein component of BamABCDE complex)